MLEISKQDMRLMEETLHQLVDGLSHFFLLTFYTSHVVQDFFHQQ